MANIIEFPGAKQTDGTPIPILLGGGLLRCSRCERTFTAETHHCVENMIETTDGLLRYADVCRACAYADPILSNWQNLCDVMDSIDQVMRDAAGQKARDLLAAVLTSAVGHLAVWRWPEDQPPYVPGDEDEEGEL